MEGDRIVYLCFVSINLMRERDASNGGRVIGKKCRSRRRKGCTGCSNVINKYDVCSRYRFAVTSSYAKRTSEVCEPFRARKRGLRCAVVYALECGESIRIGCVFENTIELVVST